MEGQQLTVTDQERHVRPSQHETIIDTMQSVIETKSMGRTSSNTSSLSARKRAKAEALKVRAEFARKEFELKKKMALLEEEKKVAEAKANRLKSECDAELQLLREEKEAVAAEIEASVLEDEDISCHGSLNLPSSNPENRTQDYVDDIIDQQNDAVQSNLSPSAKIFAPKLDTNYHCTGVSGFSTSLEFSKFLLKRDLHLSRLTVYNEQPESFEAWCCSFKSVMKDLDVSPQEELDLLVKYLGPESHKYAMSVRSSNPGQPERALQLLWERLQDRYGSPELVESCLKAKLDRFPHLTNKDNRKLFNLLDILDEIQSAKQNERLSSVFSAYDSSTGVNTIIRKLPHALRQKWVTQASAYKTEKGVLYPPFTFLIDFIRKMCKIRNDPAFCFDDLDRNRPTNERRPSTVLSCKSAADIEEVCDNTTTLWCPIHKARHYAVVNHDSNSDLPPVKHGVEGPPRGLG